MLNGVCNYFPNPAERVIQAHGTTPLALQVALTPAADAPLVGLAFKFEEGRFGQLTYMSVYQGNLKKAMQLYNARTCKKVKVPRLVRMHSNEIEVCISIYSLFFVENMFCSEKLTRLLGLVDGGCSVLNARMGILVTDGSSNFSMLRECHCWCNIWILLMPIPKHSKDLGVRS